MKVVLLGPPGSGKGTLCTTLLKSFDLSHISTGAIFREEMKNKTEIGLQIKGLMDSGDLVHDELVLKIINQHLKKENRWKKSFLLDGFPRTKNQALGLDLILERLQIPLDLVLYLKSTPSLIIKRLIGRRVCEECDASFHITNRPPKLDKICDYCEGSLVQRKDDMEETIRHRINLYNEIIDPLIQYYDEKGKIRYVDADRDPEYVQEDLISFLNE